jgi:hypothetical protein
MLLLVWSVSSQQSVVIRVAPLLSTRKVGPIGHEPVLELIAALWARENWSRSIEVVHIPLECCQIAQVRIQRAALITENHAATTRRTAKREQVLISAALKVSEVEVLLSHRHTRIFVDIEWSAPSRARTESEVRAQTKIQTGEARAFGLHRLADLRLGSPTAVDNLVHAQSHPAFARGSPLWARAVIGGRATSRERSEVASS